MDITLICFIGIISRNLPEKLKHKSNCVEIRIYISSTLYLLKISVSNLCNNAVFILKARKARSQGHRTNGAPELRWL